MTYQLIEHNKQCGTERAIESHDNVGDALDSYLEHSKGLSAKEHSNICYEIRQEQPILDMLSNIIAEYRQN